MKKSSIKKVMTLSLVGVMGMTILTGCGDKKDKNASARKVVEYSINDYVTLGQYTGLSVDEKITIVTDEDVQAELDKLVTSNTTYTEVTDRNAESGDRVTINYVKSQEGKEDENKTDYTLELGEATNGEEFDSKIIGLALNGSITFTIKEDVQSEASTDSTEETTAAAEQVDTTYTVSLTKIEQKEVPEVTDDFIKDKTDYETIAEYKENTKVSLEETNAQTAKTNAENELLQAAVDNSEIKGTPTFIYNMNYNALCQSYASYATYFGSDLEGYLSMSGSSMDDLKSQAVEMTMQTLVIEAIVKDAGIDVTDEQFDANLQTYVDNYEQFNSKEDVLKTYSREELLFDMRRDAAIDYLYKNNTVTQVKVSAE